jgi:GMP reductase
MASALAAQNCFCAVHKHYSVDDWRAFDARSTAAALSFVAVSCCASDSDFDKLTDTLALSPNLRMICLDVANGYTELFVSFLKRVRAAFPTHTIMAGNVVTGEMCEELILSGADIVKVGIGPGSVSQPPFSCPMTNCIENICTGLHHAQADWRRLPPAVCCG